LTGGIQTSPGWKKWKYPDRGYEERDSPPYYELKRNTVAGQGKEGGGLATEKVCFFANDAKQVKGLDCETEKRRPEGAPIVES